MIKTTTICDKCKAEEDSLPASFKTVNINAPYQCTSKVLHLCPTCLEKLTIVLKEKPVENKPTAQEQLYDIIYDIVNEIVSDQ